MKLKDTLLPLLNIAIIIRLYYSESDNNLTLEGQVGQYGNHSFWYCVNHLFKKNQEHLLVIKLLCKTSLFFKQNFKDEHLYFGLI